MWQYSNQVVTKLKRSSCDKIKKKKLIVTELNNTNCDKTKKKSYFEKIKKLKLWQHQKKSSCDTSLKTQIVTVIIGIVVTVAVVIVVIVTYISKSHFTPQQPRRWSWCSFSRFSLCFFFIQFCFQPSTKNEYKVRIIYKTTNTGKGPEKFIVL